MKRMDVITFIDPATGKPATKTVEVEYQDYPIKAEAVKIGGGKTVHLQLGPTPNEAFAVFAKNPAFHEEGAEVWNREARQALEIWAAKGNLTVTRIINEHGRPMNLKLEFSA